MIVEDNMVKLVILGDMQFLEYFNFETNIIIPIDWTHYKLIKTPLVIYLHL